METVDILKEGKYSAEIYERESLARFPNHKYAVKYVMDTPKGKYQKNKVLNHFVYKSLEEAKNAANSWISNIANNLKKRKEQKEKTRLENSNVVASDFYKVGDIVVNTWGWEQTNVEFYQVVKVGNKTIDIEEISQKVVEGSELSHGMACDVVANKNSFIVGGAKYKLRVKANGVLSNPSSYYYMHKWSGRPQYKSWYA